MKNHEILKEIREKQGCYSDQFLKKNLAKNG